MVKCCVNKDILMSIGCSKSQASFSREIFVLLSMGSGFVCYNSSNRLQFKQTVEPSFISTKN